ncbi:MFS transporter [Desulfocastanea catecholica]
MLAFGFLLSFISGFGQTFLLSLYVPSIEQLLSISNTEFGAIYAFATIGSAATLPFAGGYFDKIGTKRYSLLVTGDLISALLLLSFSYNIAMVLVAFYGLRLFGQGLMSHTSISCIARYFSTNRGKAIGAASVGHPVGEAVLPILITLLIGGVGWREALQVSALACAIIVASLIVFLLNQSQAKLRAYRLQARATRKNQPKISIIHVVSEKIFLDDNAGHFHDRFYQHGHLLFSAQAECGKRMESRMGGRVSIGLRSGRSSGHDRCWPAG